MGYTLNIRLKYLIKYKSFQINFKSINILDIGYFMKIQYISDLHPDNREYITKNPIQPKGDIVNDVKREEIKEVFEDYDYIKKDNQKITIDDTNNYHKISRDFLENELKKNFDGKVIVITHYVPSYKCFISRWKDAP